MSLLSTLESTAFSEWVLASMLGFPTLIALHSVGMAVAAGLSIVVAFYLNGFLAGIEISRLSGFLRVAEWGFLLNLLTGIALFIPRGTEYILSGPFLVKMVLVLFSAAILYWLRSHLLSAGKLHDGANRLARQLSLLCVVTWVGAVVAGRLIAYVGTVY